MHPGDKVSSKIQLQLRKVPPEANKASLRFSLPFVSLLNLTYRVSGSLLENPVFTSQFMWINEIIPLYSGG